MEVTLNSNRYYPESLGQWCSGFGLAFASSQQKLSDEINATMADLVQIAQVVMDAEPNQTAEQSYMELVEYVRLAAMMIYAEFNVSTHKSSMTDPLH